jgi:hypothetical protein
LKIHTNFIHRKLFYSTSDEDWQAELPKDNWCLILISNTNNEKLIDNILSESISNNVGYICGIGIKPNYIHNQADIEFVKRDIGDSKYPQPKYYIMTVGDEDFEEGIWFGLMNTFNGDVEIDKIQIIDTDCTWKSELLILLDKFEHGYLPKNE